MQKSKSCKFWDTGFISLKSIFLSVIQKQPQVVDYDLHFHSVLGLTIEMGTSTSEVPYASVRVPHMKLAAG